MLRGKHRPLDRDSKMQGPGLSKKLKEEEDEGPTPLTESCESFSTTTRVYQNERPTSDTTSLV